MSILVFTSCHSDLEDDIHSLQSRVLSLETTVQNLKTAYEGGKIVSSVSPLTADGGGWQIVFSDKSSISILNGKNGIDGVNGQDGKNGIDGVNGQDGKDGKDGKDGYTPFLKIDNAGNWQQSVDGGVTFAPLLNEVGEPQAARGEKGEEGVSVNVVSVSGYYAFATSRASVPIDTIISPLPSDPSKIMSSIVRDEVAHTITLTLSSGEAFCFNLDIAYPTGIVVLAERVVLNANGTSTFDFRVNPSNAEFSLLAKGDNAACRLDVANKLLTRSTQANAPQHYELIKIEPALNSDSVAIEGQYTATVRDLGTAEDYIEGVVLAIASRDGQGRDITLSSNMFRIEWDNTPTLSSFSLAGSLSTSIVGKNVIVKMPYGVDTKNIEALFSGNFVKLFADGNELISGKTKADFSNIVELSLLAQNGVTEEYNVAVCYSSLPIVYINTPNATPITSKEDWTKGSTTHIFNTTDGELDAIFENMSIRGRGNSTWSYPKKPYALKLDKKASVLGMPAHKRWVLLANWKDRPLMRNALAFQIASATDDQAWVPRGKFVDLVLNGKFLGNYFLCEQIKIDENRVNIAEMKAEDLDEEKITGGYLLELDTYFDEVNKFRTTRRNLPVNIKDPDEETLQPEQLQYITDYFNLVEDKLYAGTSVSSDIGDYIDLPSFVDWWFIYELTRNCEPQHPKSSYMHKARNGKLFAGPVWDFDWGSFVSSTSFAIKQSIWYTPLFTDATFVALVKEKWAIEKPRFQALANFIDNTYEEIKESAEINIKMWPINSDTNKDETLSFDEAVLRLKTNYLNRIEWLDSKIDEF